MKLKFICRIFGHWFKPYGKHRFIDDFDTDTNTYKTTMEYDAKCRVCGEPGIVFSTVYWRELANPKVKFGKLTARKNNE